MLAPRGNWQGSPDVSFPDVSWYLERAADAPVPSWNSRAQPGNGFHAGHDPPRRIRMRRLSLMLTILLAVVPSATGPLFAQSKEPVKIGLSAAVSGGSAASGEAIKRGLQI